jgi:prophage tail gpP-like protein
MARRPQDTVRIESVQGGDFSLVIDRATQYEVTTDMTQPSEARFEMGDSGTWAALKPALAIGGRYVISVNDRPRITGRMLTKALPINAQSGATVQLTIRTRLADAMFTTCDPSINVRKATLKDVILAAYKRMGLMEADFIFSADVARNLLTGKASGGSPSADVAAIKEDAARVHAPETVYSFVERHLNRFGWTHWDAPDGRIVVGAPNDEQEPLYPLRISQKDGQGNNLLSAEKTEDYEQVPVNLWVYGVGGGRDQAKAKVKFMMIDPVLLAVDPPLDRAAVVIDESIKNEAQAEARARREMSLRSLMKDAWRLEADGLSFWDGSERIAYGIDTVADVHIDVEGGAAGAYLVYRCTLRGDADNGHTTELLTTAKGNWRL